mmetsp:Transcript_12203/g.30623  ORF Transcript_12203/g.30623 Transcript_12203/m.30623 type:complete len:271 (+) Transcript_12203:236-1048(+)
MADDHEREPCPHRIIDDLGGAFAFGAVGGVVFHGAKGARNSPRRERISGAVQAIQGNARRLGGSFAQWGGLFSMFDCTAAYLRGTEDPYNSIAAGFCTGATLAARGGANAALKSGIIGGILLGIMEGLNIALQKQMGAMAPPEPVVVEETAKPGATGVTDAPAAEAPWWVKYLPQPPEEKPTVDFSSEEEMSKAPEFGSSKDDFSKSESKWAGGAARSVVEPSVDSRQLYMLIRGGIDRQEAPLSVQGGAALSANREVLRAFPWLDMPRA